MCPRAARDALMGINFASIPCGVAGLTGVNEVGARMAHPAPDARANLPSRDDRKEQAMRGFRPLHDRVLVKRVEAEERTKGGIIIPDTAKEKPAEGEVLAVGPGMRDEGGRLCQPDVVIGDIVLFGNYAGTEIIIDGEDRLILREKDILGVLEEHADRRERVA
jgi:chaperonin GroES